MKAKKSLGQHFLTSQKALKTIIESAEIKKGEQILEIGPGKGVLTEALLKAGGQVLAIEKDESLADFLCEKFEKEILEGKLEIISGDALLFSPSNHFKKNKYKIVANIPYYITGQFFRKFLSEKNQPKLIISLIQKEVAERIVARNNKESILSISVKVYGEPKLEQKVPAGSFSPPPKVDSAILSIKNISREFFDNISEEKFFEILKKGFAQKRKLLKSNLGLTTDDLNKCDIKEKTRAEDISLADWKCLNQKVK